MASLDFIYDIQEKLKKQKIDFVIMTIKRGKRNKKAIANVFTNIPNKASNSLFKSLIDDVASSLYNQ